MAISICESNRLFHGFFFSTFDMDKLGKSVGTTEKSKTAKSESDLLKTNEDIAPQRRELQTLV